VNGLTSTQTHTQVARIHGAKPASAEGLVYQEPSTKRYQEHQERGAHGGGQTAGASGRQNRADGYAKAEAPSRLHADALNDGGKSENHANNAGTNHERQTGRSPRGQMETAGPPHSEAGNPVGDEPGAEKRAGEAGVHVMKRVRKLCERQWGRDKNSVSACVASLQKEFALG
jgi:hypothetical protein